MTTLVSGITADEVWRNAARLLQDQTRVQDGRDQPTRELLHVIFSIADPRQRLVFARPINPAFAIAELIWILAGSDSSDFVLFWNPRLRNFLEPGAKAFFGAYGARLGSSPRLPALSAKALQASSDVPKVDQLRHAYDALSSLPESRQVVLQIWDSFRDLPNPGPRSKDVPCNVISHLLLRNGRLDWLQVMRSNDLFWGSPYNFIQFTCLQEIMAGWLNVSVGEYVHISDSLHVYQRHWTDLASIEAEPAAEQPRNTADLRVGSYDRWESVFGQVADVAVALARKVEVEQVVQILDRSSSLPSAYREWTALLAAESLRRSGLLDESQVVIDQAGEYWARSWRQWFEARLASTS